MQDLNGKVTGGTLSADEWNEVPSEIQNVIEALNITLSGGDLNQLGKAIAGYVANGTFYIDSGGANAYVLTTVGSKQTATGYTTGFNIQFIAGNASTGASTVNVGGLGVKSLNSTSGALDAGAIVTGALVEAVFDGTDFIIIDVIKPWLLKSSAFTIDAGKKYSIDGSGGAVDAVFKTAYVVGDEVIVHNESISTNLVRLTNTALTIKGPKGTVTSSDNLTLSPGDTAHLVAKTPTILEVV